MTIIIVIIKKGTAQSDESTIASITVIIKTTISKRILYTILLVKSPLEIKKEKNC